MYSIFIIHSSQFYERLTTLNGKSGGFYFDHVQRWTKSNSDGAPQDWFDKEKVFIPINYAKSHWALAVVLMLKKELWYYDSLRSKRTIEKAEESLKPLLLYLEADWKDKRKEGTFDRRNWSIHLSKTAPLQKNSDDCGVFTLMYADYLSQDETTLPFNQTHMQYFRARIALSIIEKRIPF